MMKQLLLSFLILFIAFPSNAQRVAAVRGVGTQTCATLVASTEKDKQFDQQAAQWILGYLTGYFRQAGDNSSRTLGDVALVQTVIDICKQNADKTIDEATTIAIAAVPNTEVKKQDKLK